MNILQVELALASKIYEHNTSLSEAFGEFDSHHRGRLSAEDLRRGLQRYGVQTSDAVIKDLIAKYDTGGDGCFDVSEFARMNDEVFAGTRSHSHSVYTDTFRPSSVKSWTHPVEKMQESEAERSQHILQQVREKLRQHRDSGDVKELFLRLDRDRSGALSYAEIRFGLHQLGLDINATDLYHILLGYDKRRNGLIELDEFWNLLQMPQTQSGVHDMTHAELMSSIKVPAALQVPTHPSYDVTIADGSQDAVAVSKIMRTFEEKKLSLRKTFAKLDTDGSGVINHDQLVKGLEEVGVLISQARAERLIKHYTEDGKDGMHYYEFVRMISSALAEAHDDAETTPASEPKPDEGILVTIASISHAIYDTYGQLRKAFVKMDKTGTKHINKEDFTSTLSRLGVSLTPSEIDSLYSKFDRDGHGLSYAEFVAMISAASPKY